MRHVLLLLPLLLPAAALSCGGGAAETEAEPEAEAAQDPVAVMNAEIAALQARPELDVQRVKVQHILIGFQGAPAIRATRSKEEAEQLAAKIYAELKTGADFTRLMSENTDDDPVLGQYLMSRDEQTVAPTLFNRYEMVPAFGEVGWRLQVGEVGVAPYDPKKSPYGWHIVLRLE